MENKTLIIVQGPTGSGKSALAVDLARELSTEIISADSRQIYRGIPIVTAAPTPEQLAAVPHHLVGILDLDQYYSAAQFEADVLDLLPRLWERSEYAVMCGGSMMYIDAVAHGIDTLPTVSPEIRARAYDLYHTQGLEALQQAVREADPDYYAAADTSNYKRLVHALELTWQAGRPYSSMLTGERKGRPFRIVRMAIDRLRDQLFDRINRRVLQMMEDGLEAEARSVYPLRHLNSLNTVGLKEMFAWFEGRMTRDEAIAKIQRNTRVYAKKQLTWQARHADELRLLDPSRPLLQQALAQV